MTKMLLATNADGVRIFRKFDGKVYKYVEVHDSKGYAKARAERLRNATKRGVRLIEVSIPHLSIYRNGAWVIYAEMKR
jgi:hypothetical protein